MYCPNCGQQTAGKFCARCGTQMPEQPDPAAQQVNAALGEDTEATSRMSQADLQAYIARTQTDAPQPGYEPYPGYGQQPYGAQPGGYQAPYTGPATAVAVAPEGSMVGGGPSSYPVSVTYQVPPSNKRLYAVPIVGFIVKVIILIPHLVILYALGLVVAVCQLFLWIPVITSGQYPEFGRSLVGGTLRWGVRVAAFYFGLTDQYPPFSFGNDGDSYPVQVAFQWQQSYKRFWAIPILGYVAKYIILIPHLLVLVAMYYVVGFLQLILWAWVLFGGRYPDFGYSFVGGWMRWGTRVYAYSLGLTDQYPAFQLGN